MVDKLSSGPASIILPLAMAGASVASPRIAHGLATGLSMVDWARRNTKTQEEQEAFASLQKYYGGRRPTGQGEATGGGPTTSVLAGSGMQNTTPATTGQGTVSGFDFAGALSDPTVQKSPAAMRFLNTVRMQKEMADPYRQLVPTPGGGSAILTIPRYGGGAPTVQTVPGVGKQTFSQGLEDMLFSAFNKGPYTPEQVRQAQDMMTDQAIAKEQRGLQKSMALQQAYQDRYFDRLERQAQNTEDRTILRNGQAEFGVLNRNFNTAMSTISKDYQKAYSGMYVGGQPIMGPDRLAAAVKKLKDERAEAEREARTQYMTQWENLQIQYPFFKGMKGGTPGYVQGLIDKEAAASAADYSISTSLERVNPQFAKEFKSILESGDEDRIKEARRIALGLIKRK